MAELKEHRVAILTEDGFEEIELTSPKDALELAGAIVHIISPQRQTVRSMAKGEWKADFPVDVPLDEAMPGDYDALLIPGGVINPDKLRTNEEALRFVQHFFESGKPVAAICHGPQVLINAVAVEGRSMTSVEAIKIDLVNAGANWQDSEVVVDRGLVTSRTPEDLPAFNTAIVEEFAKQQPVTPSSR